MNLFENAIKSVIKEHKEDGALTVYHCAKQKDLDSIFKFGFERYYCGKGVGNAYGAGVYTTFKLSSSINNAKRGEYGNIILKCILKSVDGFIIYNRELAQSIYGANWKLKDQLKSVVGEDGVNRLKNYHTNDMYYYWNRSKFTSFYDAITNVDKCGTSSECAHALAYYIDNVDSNFGKNIHGYIFFGPHDGNVCIVRNFANIMPITYSKDYGNTWVKMKVSDKLKQNTFNDVDLKYEVGDLYDVVPFYFTNDFAKVEKNGMANYLFRKTYKNGVISDVWFDLSSSDTFGKDNMCYVQLDGVSYYLYHNKNTDEIYVLDSNQEYLCHIEDFKQFLENNNEELDFD